jgi:hypothetical protein
MCKIFMYFAFLTLRSMLIGIYYDSEYCISTTCLSVNI